MSSTSIRVLYCVLLSVVSLVSISYCEAFRRIRLKSPLNSEAYFLPLREHGKACDQNSLSRLRTNLDDYISNNPDGFSQFSNSSSVDVELTSIVGKAENVKANGTAGNFIVDVNTPSWPRGDELDKQIAKLAIPAVLNFVMYPLVGAADTFWVGRMRNALALAGQGAANQVFDSAFWIISFLPSVMAPMVAKAHSSGDQEAVKQRIGEAFLLCTIMGTIGMYCIAFLPHKLLSLVLTGDAATRTYAMPYLSTRGLALIPALLSTTCFAAFRGCLDVLTPLKIAFVANAVNIIFDPIMIFPLKMGVTGAAVATCLSEYTSIILYCRIMVKKNMLEMRKFFRLPSKEALVPLLVGGFSVQMRAVAINTALLVVTRLVQLLDTSGTSAAAHTISIQLFQLGSVVSLAMSTVASILVSGEIAKAERNNDSNGYLLARKVANRMLLLGLCLGMGLGAFQLLSLPLLNVLSPLPEVQKAARIPSIIGAVLQVMSCVVWTGEGVQQGTQDFLSIAMATVVGVAGMIGVLKFTNKSLAGIWLGFGMLSLVRLIGVLRFHFFSGPLARRNLKKKIPLSL